jgi:hypothetical protein
MAVDTSAARTPPVRGRPERPARYIAKLVESEDELLIELLSDKV